MVFMQAVYLFPMRVEAAELSGEYIDKATIVVGDKLYRDSYPWDDDREYRIIGFCDAPPGGETTHVMKDFKDGDTKATIYKATKNAGGECIPDGQDTVTIGNAGWKDVTAYRINDDTVFLPFYFVKIGQSPLPRKDMTYSFNGVFKRLAEDQLKYQPYHFFLYHDGTLAPLGEQTAGYCDEEDRANANIPYDCGGTRVNTDSKVLESQYCNDGFAPGDGCVSNAEGLIFANDGKNTTPDARAGYNINSGEPSSETASGVKAPPTCESVNGTVIIGWLICSAIGALDNGIQGLVNIAENMLDINTNAIRNNVQLKAVWSYFRVLSTFLLLAVGLVMVISQALGRQ